MHSAIFFVYAGLVAYVSLRQGVGASIDPWDKLLHLLVYYIFAVFGYRAIRAGRGYWLVCLGIIAYGGVLELAQSYTPGRYMSAEDMLANTLGVLLGAAIVKRREWANKSAKWKL